MSKTAVALLCILFLGLLLALDKHYYFVVQQQYDFTLTVFREFCVINKGIAP